MFMDLFYSLLLVFILFLLIEKKIKGKERVGMYVLLVILISSIIHQKGTQATLIYETFETVSPSKVIKEVAMKKFVWMTITLLSLCVLLVGCAGNDAKKNVESYYTALMNENYEEAFAHLLIYEEYYDKGTTLSDKEAKERYMKKVQILKDNGYKLKDYEIKNVRSDDGGAPLVESELTIIVNGEEKKVKELVQVQDEGVMIDLSEEDEFAQYRDGRMNISFTQ